MYYIVLTAFAMLISSIFLIDGINALRRKSEKYEGVATALVENIEIITSRGYTICGVKYVGRKSKTN